MDVRTNSTVSSAAILDVVQTALSLDLLTEADLRDIGLEMAVLKDTSLRLDESLLITLWCWLENNGNRSELGVLIGEQVNPAAKGLLASWVSQASNLTEALSLFTENIALMNASEQWLMTLCDDQCVLTFSHSNPDCCVKEGISASNYPNMATERSMVGLISWARYLSGHDLPLTRVTFSYPEPAHLEVLKQHLGETLLFQQETNTLVFDKRFLELPVVSSNAFLKQLLAEKAQKIKASLNSQMSTVEQVKECIRQLYENEQALTVTSVCSILNVSRQTLYRQLKHEHTSFTELNDHFKKETALSLLEEGAHNIVAISLMLGFKETSSFYKAFKRWYGKLPTEI